MSRPEDEAPEIDPIEALMARGGLDSGEGLPLAPPGAASPAGALDSTDVLLADMVAEAAPAPPTPEVGEDAGPGAPREEPRPPPPGKATASRPWAGGGLPGWAWVVPAAAAAGCVWLALAAPGAHPEARPTGAEGCQRLLQELEHGLGHQDPIQAAAAWSRRLPTEPASWVAAFLAPEVPGYATWMALLRDGRGRAALDPAARRRLEVVARRLLAANQALEAHHLPPVYPHAGHLSGATAPNLAAAVQALRPATSPDADPRARLLAGAPPEEVASGVAPLFSLAQALDQGGDPEAVAAALATLLAERFHRLRGLLVVDPAVLFSLEPASRAPDRTRNLAQAIAWIHRAELLQALGAPEPDALRRAARLLLPGVPAPADALGEVWTRTAALLYGLAGKLDLARRVARELGARAPGQEQAAARELERLMGTDPARPGAPWPPLPVSLVGLLPALGEVPPQGAEEPEGWRYHPPDVSAASRYTRTRRPRREGAPEGPAEAGPEAGR